REDGCVGWVGGWRHEQRDVPKVQGRLQGPPPSIVAFLQHLTTIFLPYRSNPRTGFPDTWTAPARPHHANWNHQHPGSRQHQYSSIWDRKHCRVPGTTGIPKWLVSSATSAAAASSNRRGHTASRRTPPRLHSALNASSTRTVSSSGRCNQHRHSPCSAPPSPGLSFLPSASFDPRDSHNFVLRAVGAFWVVLLAQSWFTLVPPGAPSILKINFFF
ncbi:uncharacterized protein LOC113454295, partial [Pseudonaja textilis]|uniref:uncharacterized protein LOC113454295 n=1 Tax=Pseudonaja textilis TaxID=8673 RepID=UPI000EAA7F02